MTDRYQQFTTSAAGKLLVKRLGLPEPTPLRRFKSGAPALEGPVLVGGAPGGRLGDAITTAAKAAGLEVQTSAPGEGSSGPKFGGFVFDATGIKTPEQLRELYDFHHPIMRKLGASGRVVVLGTPPETIEDPLELVAQRALEGFTRSVGKELLKGSTAQLVYVATGAEDKVESTLRFLLSAKSAYVDAQVIRIGTHGGDAPEPEDWNAPLAGKVALVTGASRGIGESMAEVLARDGAHVIVLDIPAQGGDLAKVANRVGGSSLQLDITAADAPQKLIEHIKTRHGGIDIVVHNAGITRDKKLANMKEGLWDSVIQVNLASQLRVNDALLKQKVLRPNGRIIGVSSIAGIAGNTGQSNYGTSKAGVIGMIDAFAPKLAEYGGTINAVAPGFIETQMTAAIPLFTREGGRRLNSMLQGGLPVDVAETVAWYANPASGAVNGNVVRVCGQSLLGA
ncbi:3-oxoacyl-ACP reductase [Actinokineospora sp. G85]|uniref:3-oxoacyl-ACP reductase n=1 Tax=Actinokineospora sp. G85 TaxID=3406626 RepID=UPI003C72651A